MPVYEYACPDCGVFAATRRMADFALPAPCPGCAAPAPRTVSAPAWLGASARQRRYDAAAPGAGAASRPVSRHGMSCACCAPPSLRPAGSGGAAPADGRQEGR